MKTEIRWDGEACRPEDRIGELSEARKRGREEGREEMAREMRSLGRPKSEIQQVLDLAGQVQE